MRGVTTMPDFYVMDKTREQVRRVLQFQGDVKALSVDFSTWADDNAAVTSVVWSVESGQAAISAQSLANNVASALITTTTAGSSMIKLLATDGTHSEAVYIRVMCKDPQTTTSDDYGLCHH